MLRKPTVVTVGYHLSPLRGSRQNVGRGDSGAERTDRCIAHFLDGINAAFRARRNFAGPVELDVRRQIVGEIDGFTIGLASFQRELIGCGINLAKMIDTAIGRTGVSRPKTVGRVKEHKQPEARRCADPNDGFPR